MPHNPPVPEGSQSPYPLRQPQALDRAGTKRDLADKAAAGLETKAAAEDAGNRWPRYAAGAAIGSAAIVAGLLYYNRAKAP